LEEYVKGTKRDRVLERKMECRDIKVRRRPKSVILRKE